MLKFPRKRKRFRKMDNITQCSTKTSAVFAEFGWAKNVSEKCINQSKSSKRVLPPLCYSTMTPPDRTPIWQHPVTSLQVDTSGTTRPHHMWQDNNTQLQTHKEQGYNGFCEQCTRRQEAKISCWVPRYRERLKQNQCRELPCQDFRSSIAWWPKGRSWFTWRIFSQVVEWWLKLGCTQTHYANS